MQGHWCKLPPSPLLAWCILHSYACTMALCSIVFVYILASLPPPPFPRQYGSIHMYSYCLSVAVMTVPNTHFIRTLQSKYTTLPHDRRKIRLIESNAKCRYLKKGLCGRCLICMRPLPLLWPHTPPPPCTLYTCIQVPVYAYSHSEGGRGELTREKVRGAIVHKAVR